MQLWKIIRLVSWKIQVKLMYILSIKENLEVSLEVSLSV